MALAAAEKTIPTGLSRFWVYIGERDNPRLAFGVMAENAQEAGEQADDYARLGERVDVMPAGPAPVAEPQAMDLDAMRRAGW